MKARPASLAAAVAPYAAAYLCEGHDEVDQRHQQKRAEEHEFDDGTTTLSPLKLPPEMQPKPPEIREMSVPDHGSLT